MLKDLVFELRLALKFLFVKPRGFYRLARFFTIATLGIGVGALLLSLSAFEGYKKIISERYLDSSSHLIVSKRFDSQEDVKQKVLSVIGKDVQAISYSGYIELMLASDAGIKGSAFQVLEKDSFDGVIPLWKYMKQGAQTCVLDTPDGIILGSVLAEELGLKINDAVNVVYLKSVKKLTVCGISEYGLYDLDSRISWMAVNTAKKIFPEAELDTAVKIRLKDDVNLEKTASYLQEELGYLYEVRSWEDLNYGLLESVKLDRMVMFFILGVLIAVSVFNVFATLMILIREMRVEISVLNILGLNRKRTLRVFFIQALILGISGYLLGILMWAASFWAVKSWGLINLPKDIYLVSTIPMGASVFDLLSVFLMVLLFVSLASIAPLMHLFNRFKKEGSAYGVKGQWAQ
ncbi:MAG TPA: ABC transporter permease [bacterium]|nr:ABC transporter permease [bacterium]